MISKELNEQLTGIERGQPAGEVLRRYWQPAALTENSIPPGPLYRLPYWGGSCCFETVAARWIYSTGRVHIAELTFVTLDWKPRATLSISWLEVRCRWAVSEQPVSRKGRSTTNGSAPGRIRGGEERHRVRLPGTW